MSTRSSSALKDTLAEICKKHIIRTDVKVVISEPYIPYIPDDWNGTLILAEAQNLSKSKPNDEYVKMLETWNSIERIKRLDKNEHSIGIQPWDDGTLKLAIESAFPGYVTKVAVSNAILWSIRSETGYNDNPNKTLIAKSVEIWTELIQVMNPTSIVTAGAKARQVIYYVLASISTKPMHVVWALPSPRVLNPLDAMISESELLIRFPEVKRAIDVLAQEKICKNPDKQHLLYACLAVREH